MVVEHRHINTGKKLESFHLNFNTKQMQLYSLLNTSEAFINSQSEMKAFAVNLAMNVDMVPMPVFSTSGS